MSRCLAVAALLCSIPACGGDDAPPQPPVADVRRDVASTGLAIDLAAQTGTATIALAASPTVGGSLEVGDLEITAVTVDGAPIEFFRDGAQLDLGIGTDATTVTIDYGWRFHDNSDGIATAGYTLTWPYYCGNMFPCRSNPADGTRFELALSGVPAGDTAVFPATIGTDSAAYQLAWVVGPYQRTSLGTTTAGTEVVVWNHANEMVNAIQGTRHLRAGFEWMEQNLGPYRFGTVAGSVSAHWGGGAYGGMEHHPLWHVASDAMGDESVHMHEAAHGWFGDGVRLACWEDFVLSEGAASYYEARLVEEVGDPGAGDAAWAAYESELTRFNSPGGGNGIAWPQTCGAIDVLDIFTRAPYVKGALFLRAVERKIGRPMFDLAMRRFYQAHDGEASGVVALVAMFQEVSGYDASACAQTWLAERPVPTEMTCP